MALCRKRATIVGFTVVSVLDALEGEEARVDNLETRILDALSDSRWQWRTIGGVAKQLQLPPDTVNDLIQRMPDKVIRARLPDVHGRALYATREHYMKTHSAIKRLLDQLK